MKKICLVIVMAICSLTASSQLRYGLKLGGEFTRPSAKDFISRGGSGFVGGLQLEYSHPTSGFALGADLLYERRNLNTMEESSEDALKFGGDFIALPITLKYKIPIKAIFELASPFVATGPDFALRVSEASGSKFHTGWNFGIGIDVINFLQLSAGYRLGINDICPGAGALRDSGWSFSIGFLFDF